MKNNNFMIKYIPQSTDLTCGQACVAMLANIGTEEAIDKMCTDFMMEPIDIINGLKKCGVKCDDKFVKITVENPSYPPVCVLLIKFPDYVHWVVHYHGKFYDPEFGILDECVSHEMIESYLLVYLNEEILQTALNYIEGWYEGNVERMGKALHPNMIKRSITNNEIKELDYKTMMDFTKNGGGKNIAKDTYSIEVTILEINNDIATVVTKSEYIDYLHLAKIDGKWMIVNIFWDFYTN